MEELDEWLTKPRMDDTQVQNCITVAAGHAETLKCLWRDSKTFNMPKANPIEAGIRLGCPLGHTRKSVKNSQSVRIPMFQLWERSNTRTVKKLPNIVQYGWRL